MLNVEIYAYVLSYESVIINLYYLQVVSFHFETIVWTRIFQFYLTVTLWFIFLAFGWLSLRKGIVTEAITVRNFHTISCRNGHTLVLTFWPEKK